MNKLRWHFLLVIFLLIIFNVGCTEKPEHSNPFDPLSPSYNHGQGSITGKILQAVMILRYPPEEYPIAGVEIIATKNGEKKGAVISDSEGRYIISNLFAGNYDLTASALGYKIQTVKGISVIAGQTTEYYIELLKE